MFKFICTCLILISTSTVLAAECGKNPAASEVAGTSPNAPRLVVEGQTLYLSEHGKRRVLTGYEAIQAQGYIEDFWRKFPTGYQREADRIADVLRQDIVNYTGGDRTPASNDGSSDGIR